ncbi:MAG: hypothetical protein GWN58_48975, partial [Anaerolineae bacterium]|nr:hypothetical protein [Anaerolineae bacterium]
RLLEELLGIDRIDSARELCVADLSGAEQSLASAEAHLQALESGHTTVLRSLQALEAPSPGSKPPSESQMRSTRDALSAAISESKQIRKASTVKERELGAQNAELAQLQRHMRQLLDERCPTCQQTVPVELRESLQTRLQALVDQIADAKDALAEENALSASMLEELEDEVVALRMKLYKM